MARQLGRERLPGDDVVRAADPEACVEAASGRDGPAVALAGVLLLLSTRSVGVAALGMLVGVLCTYAALAVARPIVQHAYGLMLQWPAWSLADLTILCGFLLAATLAGAIPVVNGGLYVDAG